MKCQLSEHCLSRNFNFRCCVFVAISEIEIRVAVKSSGCSQYFSAVVFGFRVNKCFGCSTHMNSSAYNLHQDNGAHALALISFIQASSTVSCKSVTIAASEVTTIRLNVQSGPEKNCTKFNARHFASVCGRTLMFHQNAQKLTGNTKNRNVE